jgi:Ca-activated chloride channel homolog
MEEADFPWSNAEPKLSRKEAAERVFQKFVTGRPNDAIGLVTFALTPYPVCPPTLQHEALLKCLYDARPRGILEAGTNVGDAIAQGLILLENAPTTRRVLILLTDGEHNFDRDDPDRKPLRPLQAAQLAANLQIPIHTIDTGPVTDSPQRAAGRSIHQSIAERTGGLAFAANDGDALTAAGETLNRYEIAPIPSPIYRRYHSHRGACLLATLLAIVIGWYFRWEIYFLPTR